MKRKFFGFIAALLAVFMTFSATEALAGVTYKDAGTPKYQADSDSILGIAADFGIFADEIEMTAHVHSNAACNTLRSSSNLTVLSHSNGVIYAKDYQCDKALGIENKYSNIPGNCNELTVCVGSDYSLEKQNNGGRWILKKNGQEMTIDCNTKTTFIKENSADPFISITDELSSLEKTAKVLAGLGDTDKDIFKKDSKDDQWIVCNNDENVANISYTKFGDRPLYIDGIKDTEHTLIVNVTDLSNTDTVKIPKIEYKGASVDNENAKYAQNTIWNFGDYTGTVITGGDFAGTILAPKATVKIGGGNIVGSVIAQKFINTNGEVHFVFNRTKKINTEVTVSIQALDGTCCDKDEFGNPVSYRLLPGVKVALYKKIGNKYKKQTTRTTKSDATASWTIDKTGDYCIKALSAPDGFIKTPIKCLFTVDEDDNGVLRINVTKGKEGNGQSNTGKASDDKTSASFKIRFYSDSIYMAAYDGTDGSLVHINDDSLTVTDSLGSGVTVGQAQGLQDETGNAYDMKESHITNPGRYTVQLLGETKDIDIYLLPSGLYLSVEYDESGIAENIFNSFGKYELTKIKSGQQKLINDYMKSHEELFDGCLFFEVDAPQQTASNEG